MRTNNAFVIVENNAEGQQFIKTLRKYLRNTPKGVQVYGRGPRPAYPRYQNNLPHGMSKRLAVYLYDKPTTRMKKVQRVVTEWVQVPTKWAKPAPAFGHPDL